MSRHTASIGARALLGIFLIVICGTWTAARSPDKTAFDRKSLQLRQLRRDVQAIRLLQALRLTDAQRQQVLEIAGRADEITKEYGAERKERLQEMLDTFRQFRDETQANEGFSPGLERRTGRLNHVDHSARDAYFAEIQGLEEEVRRVLTPGQRRIVSDFKSHPGRGRRRDRIRDDSPLDDAVMEMTRLTSNRPRPGTISRCLFPPEAVTHLQESPPFWELKRSVRAKRKPPRLSPETGNQQTAGQEAELALIRHDVTLLNLVNGLHLTSAQVSKLITCAEAAKKIRSRDGGRFSANTSVQLAVMKQVRLDMYRFGRVREKTTEGIRRIRRSLSGQSRRLGRPASTTTVRDVEMKVESLLTEGQRLIVVNYKPCLISNIKDPIRVGQASDGTRELRMLERIRRMRSDRVSDRMLDRLLEKEEQHLGAYTATEREARRRQLVELVKRVRAMSDTEFHVHKDKLIAELQAADRVLEAGKKLDDLRRNEMNRPGKFARFLLDARIIPILKKRGS